MRGRERVAQDFKMLCAAVNLQRLARFELRSVPMNASIATALKPGRGACGASASKAREGLA